MASLISILGGPFVVPDEISPEQQLKDAIRKEGLTPPEQIFLDGKLHRFASGTKGEPGHGDKPGWYVAFSDGVPAGRFGCWRAGIENTWKADHEPLTMIEDMNLSRRISEAKVIRDAELEKVRAASLDAIETIWSNGMLALESHAYLVKKGIQPHGVRITGDGRLMVPLFDEKNDICSIQYINVDGEKLYHSGAPTKGKFWMLGTLDEPGVLYVAEGFATAATIHEATMRPCVVAFSASNIVPVVEGFRERNPNQLITIVADNDKNGIGQKYADQASAKYGATVIVIPVEGMDANDYAGIKDLNALLEPKKPKAYLISVKDFATKPAPIKWLIKGWLQDNASIMLFGPSGLGKTFLALDWGLHIASEKNDWLGRKINHGPVVYLAGEGHHGIKGRVAAWMQSHQVTDVDMVVSTDSCDINTPTGYDFLLNHITSLSKSPRLIIIDTLNRFFFGDENSAKDTKTMLDACKNLMVAFDCSVMIVHHTGVSDEAQHRVRGSSAWKGAMDIEIGIGKAKCKDPVIEVTQRKSKDAQEENNIYLHLQPVDINGWLDDEGKQVSSAIIMECDKDVEREERKSSKPSPIFTWKKQFERAWFKDGSHVIVINSIEVPFITRDGLRDILIIDGYSKSGIKNHLNPNETNRLIGGLILADMIDQHEDGWVVSDEQWIGIMMMLKNNHIT